MNIQQMRYVTAIANNGSFREAAKKLYVSQPSLSHAIKELEQELNVQLFERTSQGAYLTKEGSDFFQYAQQILSQVELLENRYATKSDHTKHFSIASQHYDFLSIILSEMIQDFPECESFRIYENTTLSVIKDVEEYRSELGILYLNASNKVALERMFKASELTYEVLHEFQTHIFLGENHPLATKAEITLDDLIPYPQIRFSQESAHYTYFSEDLLDFPEVVQVIHASDRATLTGILTRTNAYGSGSGLVEDGPSQGILLIPLANAPKSQLIAIRQKDRVLSDMAESFLSRLKDYLQHFHQSK